MLIALLISGSLAVAAPAADTTIPVERGMRLGVESLRGDVVVEAWERDEVRATSRSSRSRLEAVRAGSLLRVRPAAGRTADDTDMEIRVPRWMDVRVEANQGDVAVEGTGARIEVETVQGNVLVSGGSDVVSVESIQGEIAIRGARGRIEAMSVNEDVRLQDVSGEVFVETTNGDVSLRGVEASSVRARTMNGDVTYDGALLDRGHYVLTTHNGDLVAVVPEDADATVSVATYHGDFEADFPIRFTGTTRDRQFQFTLGSGGARIELESFNGEIRLQRPR